ncbi:hypothetical protein [uncultured Ruminococcus sp.]|uniref:hypothetical protein n=1 Tax=uncultured Ruminococcus sp. TaxID=165186 RepID=UPI003438DB6B
MDNIKARFHLPGLTGNFKMNMVLITMLENCPEYFRDGVEIASLFGAFPPSVWNGGRPIGGFTCSPDYIYAVVEACNSRGIPVRFTFTNPMLKEEHLKDDYCNMVMQIANNGLNEVIVFSELLENYIRETYPKYKVTSSTCKRITDPVKLHEELNKDYNVVVLDYDLNNRWDILDDLPHKEKVELLANSSCIPNCQKRSDEYETCGLQMIAYNEHIRKYPGKPFDMKDYSNKTLATDFDCPAMRRDPFEIRTLRQHISPDLIWNEYLPRGFNQFKLSGRGTGRLWVLETYMYYLIKPECRDEARFIFMHNLEKNGVIKIDNM